MSDNREYDERMARMKKRNRVLGMVLWGFVLFLAVMSFYRMKGLAP